MRRIFQVSLLVVAFIPFAFGLMNFLGGAAAYLPDDDVTARLDNQMRFSAIWSMLPFLLTLWIVRNLDIAGPVLTIVLCATALAGLARLYSVTHYGLPEPFIAGAITLELGVLLFIPWHRLVVAAAKPSI
ncbi:MAG: DUF4345 domain-containing protein [Pseudomonadota bacterium]